MLFYDYTVYIIYNPIANLVFYLNHCFSNILFMMNYRPLYYVLVLCVLYCMNVNYVWALRVDTIVDGLKLYYCYFTSIMLMMGEIEHAYLYFVKVTELYRLQSRDYIPRSMSSQL